MYDVEFYIKAQITTKLNKFYLMYLEIMYLHYKYTTLILHSHKFYL